jgi:hypothetical protein
MGIFPEGLKTSRITPIFKGGDPLNPDNYRPISLLNTVSKILEKYVATVLQDHLSLFNLINENQFGFQKNTSTLHSLTKLTSFISKEINNKNFVLTVFLDLRKAFDVVSHPILLKKLSKFGINGVALSWFENYLFNRTQRVEINGAFSSLKTIDISVLQGSILGPILFLCFINDLPKCTDLLTLLFADDAAVSGSNKDLNILINKINTELKSLSRWFRANKMAVNVSKTKFMIFKPAGVFIDESVGNRVIFDDNDEGLNDASKIFSIDRVFDKNTNLEDRTFKFLGLYLDENLSFNEHCKKLINKISNSIYIMNRVKNLLPSKYMKTLYFTLVHPHLLYCLPIYGCTTGKNIGSLEKMQKRAVRIVVKADYLAHTAPIFESLGIMPLKTLLEFNQGLLMHSVIHNYAPPSLLSIWNFDRQHDRTLRNTNDIHVPFARTDQTKRLPYCYFPKLWNSLHEQKWTPNPITFKISFKQILLNPDL